MIEMYQNSVKASMGWNGPAATAPVSGSQPIAQVLQAALAPQPPQQQSAPAASPVPKPSSAPAPALASAAGPKSPPSNSKKRHIISNAQERKPLLAVAIPQNLAPTFAQIKSLLIPTEAEESTTLDGILSWMSSLATQPTAPAPPKAGDLITQLLRRCAPNEAFHLLLVARLLVASPAFVKTIPSMHVFRTEATPISAPPPVSCFSHLSVLMQF